MRIILIVLFSTMPVMAQHGDWGAMEYEATESLRHLIVLQDSSVYTASLTRVFEWQSMDSLWMEQRSFSDNIWDLIADPASPHGMVIVSGTHDINISRSLDGGDTWFTFGNVGDNTPVAIFAGALNQFYVSCYPDDLLRINTSGFQRIVQGINTKDLSVRYVSSYGDDRAWLAMTTPGEVYYTQSHGDSWQTAKNGIGDDVSIQHLHLHKSIAFASTHLHGVMRSVSPGGSWQAANNGLGSAGDPSMSVRMTISHPDGSLISVTSGGMFKSRDEGDSWSAFGAGIPDWSQIKHAVISPEGHYYLLYGENRIYVSTDDAISWQLLEPGLTFGAIKDVQFIGNGVIMAAEKCCFQSENRLYYPTWFQQIQGLSTPRLQKLVMLPNGTLMAFDENGATHTLRDSENLWNTYGNGLSGSTITASDLTQEGIIFAGSEDGRIYRSSDDGNTWTEVFRGAAGKEVSAILCAPDSTIYCAFLGAGVFRSTDGGMQWTQAWEGVSNDSVTALAHGAVGDIFAGTNGSGVFRSTDAGVSWSSISLGLPDLRITSLVCNVIGILAAGTKESGVFLTRNDYSSWIDYNSGLQDSHITGLYMYQSTQLYAATEEGLLYSDFAVLPTSVNDLTIAKRPEIRSIHPTPVRDRLTVTYVLERAGDVKVSIHNMLGQEVRSIYTGFHEAGTSQADMSMTGLPGGTYILHLGTEHSAAKCLVSHIP